MRAASRTRFDHYEFIIDAKVYRFETYQILHGKYADPNDSFVGIGVAQTIPNYSSPAGAR